MRLRNFAVVLLMLVLATLLGVALYHRRTLEVAAAGLLAIVLCKLAFGGFHGAPGLDGLLLLR